MRKKSLVRITLHSKVVLITSATLTLGMSIFIFFGEFLGGLDAYGLWDKMQIAFFQSVTLRTAGFNTIPLNNFNTYTIYAMSILMFIGASPGSTGGGIKTTTLAILIQSIKATLRGKDRVEMFDRTIPSSTVVKATALTFLSIVTVVVLVLFLIKAEPNQSFLSLMFEVISATGTVGLSLGITPYLSVLGKLIIILAMFIGRVGPLTLILAVGMKKSSHGKYEYPGGKIMIG